MSYCRWSSDNWKSDIYAYKSKDGYVIHIAAQRIVGDAPPLADIEDLPTEYFGSVQRQSEWMVTAARRDIDLPYSGETFTEACLEDFEARLKVLVEIGYHVPAHVFDEITYERNGEPPDAT